MIKHIGDKWILFTKDGSKRLGSHSSEADAKAQEAAIEISKHRSAEDGEEVFESLHLLGATGHSRYEMWDGKRYLVVPTVALMEGVIHAVNASSPEYVPKALLETNPEAWDGHPILLGHAVRGGKQCSAHDEAILNAQQFGTIRKTHAKDGKLGMESWVDPVRLKELGREDVLKRLEKNEPISVSVGAFVSANGTESEYRGKRYKGEWLTYHPDHLAYLPDGKGACSLEMGCGTHRAAMHLVTAEGFELKDLGGPGSGWTAEGGHVPGAQGGSKKEGKFGKLTHDPNATEGHAGATAAHFDAAGAHAHLAWYLKHSTGTSGAEGMAAHHAERAAKATATAVSRTKATGTKPYVSEAAASYSKLAGSGAKADQIKFHQEAAKYHESAAKWHQKAEKYSGGKKMKGLAGRVKALITAAFSPEEAVEALAMYDTPEQAASEEAAELISYTTMRSLCDQVGSSYKELSSLIDDLISDEEENPTETASQEEAEEEVECARLEAVQTLVASMNSTLWQVQALAAKLLMPDLPEPASPRYNEELRTALSKTVDEKTLSVIFDQRLVELEDGEEDAKLEIRAAECRCEEKNMTRAERIAALLKSEHNPLKDQKSLEASSDEGLKLLEVHVTNAASLKAAADKKAEEKKAEELKAAELKAAEEKKNTQLSEEDYLKTAPDSIRTLVADSKARTAIRTAELVTELKTAQDAYTEDELKKLPLETLEKLAKVAGLDAPVSADFTLARPRAAQENDVYANPPDGYALAIEKRSGKKEAVN